MVLFLLYAYVLMNVMLISMAISTIVSVLACTWAASCVCCTCKWLVVKAGSCLKSCMEGFWTCLLWPIKQVYVFSWSCLCFFASASHMASSVIFAGFWKAANAILGARMGGTAVQVATSPTLAGPYPADISPGTMQVMEGPDAIFEAWTRTRLLRVSRGSDGCIGGSTGGSTVGSTSGSSGGSVVDMGPDGAFQATLRRISHGSSADEASIFDNINTHNNSSNNNDGNRNHGLVRQSSLPIGVTCMALEFNGHVAPRRALSKLLSGGVSRQSDGGKLLCVHPHVGGNKSLNIDGAAGLAMFAGRMGLKSGGGVLQAFDSPSAAAVAGAAAGAAGKGGLVRLAGVAAASGSDVYRVPAFLRNRQVGSFGL